MFQNQSDINVIIWISLMFGILVGMLTAGAIFLIVRFINRQDDDEWDDEDEFYSIIEFNDLDRV